jgi:hypothetical protein
MSETIRLKVDQATTETIQITDLGNSRLRLEATPLSAALPLYRGDVVEVAVVDPATFRLVRVVQRAAYLHQSWVVGRGFSDSSEHGSFCTAVEAAGGSVETLLGGLLHVHLPEGSLFDADGELDRALAAHARRTESILSRVGRWLLR